jgi:hypothetical protein
MGKSSNSSSLPSSATDSFTSWGFSALESEVTEGFSVGLAVGAAILGVIFGGEVGVSVSG